MKWINLVFFLAFSTIVSNIAKAQVFNIKTLEGKNQQINFKADEEKLKLTISLPNDTIHIRNVIGLKSKIIVINNNFLKIEYSIMIGSDMQAEQTLLLCIKNNKLTEAIHIMSLFKESAGYIDTSKPKSETNPVHEDALFYAKMNINPSQNGKVELLLKSHNEKKSNDPGEANYKYNKELRLQFDRDKGIFYNKLKTISANFKVFDPKTQKRNSIFIKGRFPNFDVGESNYYFLKGYWYKGDEYNDLSRFIYR